MNWLRRWICGVRGHDAILRIDRSRISLVCMSCGFETPGWDLRASPAPRAAKLRGSVGSRAQNYVAGTR